MSEEETDRHYGLDVANEDEELPQDEFPTATTYGEEGPISPSLSDLTVEWDHPRTYEVQSSMRDADEVIVHDDGDTIRIIRDKDGTIHFEIEICAAVQNISQTITVGGVES